MKTLLISLVLALVAFGQQPPLRPIICADAGANDTYTCTATPTLTAYAAGQIVLFTPNTANTGAATVNIDSLGAKTIVKLGGAINTALADNDLRANQRVILQYDGTNFQMLSQTGNAAAGGSNKIWLTTYFNAGSGIAAGTTSYYTVGPYNGSLIESSGEMYMPTAGTINKLAIRLSTVQPSGQTLTCAVRKIAAAAAWDAAGTDTAVVASAPGSTARGWVTSSSTDTFAAGDRLTIGCSQAAGASASGGLRNGIVEIILQ